MWDSTVISIKIKVIIEKFKQVGAASAAIDFCTE